LQAACLIMLANRQASQIAGSANACALHLSRAK
jgi:hypothetical protein